MKDKKGSTEAKPGNAAPLQAAAFGRPTWPARTHPTPHTPRNSTDASRCELRVLLRAAGCAGEALLHPSNMEHIAKDHASSVGVAQLYAFADQGFLYHGQMRFTRSDFERPEANNTRRTDGSGVHAAGAGAGREGSAGGAAAEARPGAAEQGAMRALRITRDGHLYSADMADLEATARAALAALNAGSGVAAEGSAGGARNQRPTHGSQGSGRAQGPGSEINALRGVAEAAEGEVVIPGGLADGVASSGGSAQGVEDAYPDPLTTTTRGHAGGRRLQGIFGPDDRIDCPRTLTYPFTSIGQINIKDKLGSYVCSGALIGPDVVLTAAHCVFSRANQGFYEGLSFAPSRYLKEDGGAVDPYGMVPWTYVTIYQVRPAGACRGACLRRVRLAGLRATLPRTLHPCFAFSLFMNSFLPCGASTDRGLEPCSHALP